MRLRKKRSTQILFWKNARLNFFEAGCLNFELPQNSHNEAAYLKTKAACLKIKKMRQSTSKVRQPASNPLNKKKFAEPASKPINLKTIQIPLPLLIFIVSQNGDIFFWLKDFEAGCLKSPRSFFLFIEFEAAYLIFEVGCLIF